LNLANSDPAVPVCINTPSRAIIKLVCGEDAWNPIHRSLLQIDMAGKLAKTLIPNL